MVRVPTYMSHMNKLNQTLANKQLFDLYNFQTLTGIKAPTYGQIGKASYNIVSLEASLTVANNFMENNKIVETETKLINVALESIRKNVDNAKSALLDFNGHDMSKITPDYTGGKIVFGNDTVADYMGKTITIDGTQYTFANDNLGNNIDISTAANGEDVMNALQAKLPANPDFVFTGNTFEFPLYTINGTSNVLNVQDVTTGEPHTLDEDQQLALKQMQSVAFAAMVAMVDALNISANGKYLFGGGNSVNAPVEFPFKNLQEFQDYYDGVNIKYPTTANANLTNRSVSAADTGDLTLQLTGSNTGTISATNSEAFLKDAVTANASTTGDLTFDAAKNTIKATEAGAFGTIKEGETLVIKGTGGANDKVYVVKSVSQDGKTITVDSSTPVVADQNITPTGNVKFSTSFPIGSVVNMDGFGRNIAGKVQVTGVSADGKTLEVRVDPDYFPSTPTVVSATTGFAMGSDSYYNGGSTTYETRISDSQSLLFDVNANDPAFEKLFRALGQIAQGNVVDTRNPADELDSLINHANAGDIVDQALNLVYDALMSPNNKANTKNNDLTTVMAKMNSNYVQLNNVNETLKIMSDNLQTDVGNLKNVDQTEAGVKALVAKQNLEASYSVLQSALSMSLLNYLK